MGVCWRMLLQKLLVWTATITLMSLVAGAMPGWAAEQPPPAGTGAGPQVPPPFLLPEVQVTATRGEKETYETPQRVDIIEQQVIERTFPFHLNDALQRLPNVSFGSSGANPNYWERAPTIRGLGLQHVKVMSDGMALTAQGIGYGGGHLSLFDPHAVDRVEVVRGPVSVLYGTDAIGGVINVFQRRPTRREEFRVEPTVASSYDSTWNLWREKMQLDLGGGPFAMVMGADFTNAGDVRTPGSRMPFTAFHERNAYVTADYWFDASKRFTLRGQLFQGRDIEISRDTSFRTVFPPFVPPGITVPLEFSFPAYDRSLLAADLDLQDLGPQWRALKITASVQQTKREFARQTPVILPPPPPFPLVVRSFQVLTDDRTTSWDLTGQSTHRLFGRHTITWGTDLGLDQSHLPEIESQVNIATRQVVVRTDRTRARADQRRLGIFGQDEIDLEPLVLTLGTRWDGFQVEDDLAHRTRYARGFSGAVSLLWHALPQLHPYVNVASGFRVPDLGERFQDTVFSIFRPVRTIGNPDLSPERSYHGELGLKTKGDWWSGEAALFWDEVHDFIGTRVVVPARTGVAEVDQFTNFGVVHLYGYEALLTVRPFTLRDDLLRGLEVFGNVGKTFTRNKASVRAPGVQSVLGAAYTLSPSSGPVDTYRGEFSVRLSEGVLDETQPVTSFRKYLGYAVADMGLQVKLRPWGMLQRASLNLAFKNLFDSRFRVPYFSSVQPGRGVAAGISIAF